MKKMIIIFLIVVVAVGTGMLIKNIGFEQFGFSKNEYTIIDEYNTHGVFHGDGYYYLILDCSANKDKALKTIEKWNKLPLSENLESVMYGGLTYNGLSLAETARIPKVENGRYMFKDRFPKSKNRKDDTNLMGRGAYNFSIAIYDCDTDKMYYFEFDT